MRLVTVTREVHAKMLIAALLVIIQTDYNAYVGRPGLMTFMLTCAGLNLINI